MRLMFANQAGAPRALNLVWSRSGVTEVTLQRPMRMNGALNSSWLIGRATHCNPSQRPEDAPTSPGPPRSAGTPIDRTWTITRLSAVFVP